MNCTFRLPQGGEALEKQFVQEASERGIKGVNGHRSVGGASSSPFLSPLPCSRASELTRAGPAGIRTSIYNAVTLEDVKKLVAFMREFREKNAQA